MLANHGKNRKIAFMFQILSITYKGAYKANTLNFKYKKS